MRKSVAGRALDRVHNLNISCSCRFSVTRLLRVERGYLKNQLPNLVGDLRSFSPALQAEGGGGARARSELLGRTYTSIEGGQSSRSDFPTRWITPALQGESGGESSLPPVASTTWVGVGSGNLSGRRPPVATDLERRPTAILFTAIVGWSAVTARRFSPRRPAGWTPRSDVVDLPRRIGFPEN